MDKFAVTKRQHYVPQFLLRNFSPDGRRISLIGLASGAHIAHAKIARQCYEDYFYGRDSVMETTFSKEERYIASELGELNVDRLERMGPKTLLKLKLFVHYLRARTLGGAEKLNSMVDAFAKSCVSPHSDPTEASELDLIRVRMEDAQHENLWVACTSTPLLLDLAVKFIVTQHLPGFVVSDHPVVMYNQYAEHHPDLQHCLSITGFVTRGLQMFLPLSPRVTLAVYDPSVYQYGSQHRQICRAGPSDVALLNAMQAIQALNCFYFLPECSSDVSLDELLRRRQGHPSVYKRAMMKSDLVPRPNGKFSQFVVVSGGDIRLGAKLSFVRLLDCRRIIGYEKAYPPERSPELVDLAERFRDAMNKIVEEQREALEKMSPDEVLATALRSL